MADLSEYVDGVPNICGAESEIERIVASGEGSEVYRHESRFDFSHIKSACCIALHMHQPLIPEGNKDSDKHSVDALISNLDHMMRNPDVGDNHNAGVFHWCYKRIGEFVPELVHEGKEPRVMLEYSGTLFHGMRHMGLHDVFDTLKGVTCNPDYRRCVEWLGCPWGHAVAPSTPVQDYRLHVRAWQHHFASIFGEEALSRVRGFSPSEMALPNEPDVAYEFVKTLRDCGYQWVLVQEHTVEQPHNGSSPERPHLPHRLVCKNSAGETTEIIALIKTQGSDTKLVAQMQPWYEAQGLSHVEVGGKHVPPIVTQIADGENGGVMMNEFPEKFKQGARDASGSEVPLVNGSEYLEHLFAQGISPKDLPELQPVKQKQLWERISPGDGPEKMAKAIEELKKEDHQFHMDGGSWTNNISWVEGYDNVLGPMEKVSILFREKLLDKGIPTTDHRFRSALFYLMCSQTSCYRYWGQGMWTDYGRDICARAERILKDI